MNAAQDCSRSRENYRTWPTEIHDIRGDSLQLQLHTYAHASWDVCHPNGTSTSFATPTCNPYRGKSLYGNYTRGEMQTTKFVCT